jgi:hypothetical protein
MKGKWVGRWGKVYSDYAKGRWFDWNRGDVGGKESFPVDMVGYRCFESEERHDGRWGLGRTSQVRRSDHIGRERDKT